MLIGYFNKYKNYIGTIEYEFKSKSCHGKVINCNENHLVDYIAQDILELEKEFHNAVDDYLEFCKYITMTTVPN